MQPGRCLLLVHGNHISCIRGGFLRLSHWLKFESSGSSKSLSQMVFTEGVSVETKLIKKPQWFFVPCDHFL